jgi:hypothetical protein
MQTPPSATSLGTAAQGRADRLWVQQSRALKIGCPAPTGQAQHGGEMAFWNRGKRPVDRISSEDLANYGRWEFLKEQSGIEPSSVYGLISPLNCLLYTGGTAASEVIHELRRHAPRGPWEKVGAWKYARDFLDNQPEAQELIDDGLRAIHAMRVTNLAIHLSRLDAPRYEEITGVRPMNDGFWGPPVFDSGYGPTKQYYFDHALASATSRTITRLPASPGVAPGSLAGLGSTMWDFGMLLHCGPLVVNPDIAIEPNVVRPAVAAASGADHSLFADGLAEQVSAYIEKDFQDNATPPPWSALGAARFIEDYLDQSALSSNGYQWLLDKGCAMLLADPGYARLMCLEILTPRQHAQLENLRAAQ